MKTLFKILSLIFLAIFLNSCIDDIPDPNDNNTTELLVGTWAVVENSATYGTQNYDVAIYKYEIGDDMIKIYNFYGLGSWSRLIAGVDDKTITIVEQTIEGHVIFGMGTISDDYKSIEFSYNVEEVSVAKSLNSEDVTATFTKK